MLLRTPETLPQQLPPRLCRALRRLQELQTYSRCTTGNSWDYAASYSELRGLGLRDNDFRFLVIAGWIEHQCLAAATCRSQRCFEPAEPLCFSKLSRFVLSPRGTAITAVYLTIKAASTASAATPLELSSQQASNALRPNWRPLQRELWLGDVMVKQFRWPAPNQELVLAAFEEEGWPPRIDDPLPPSLDQEPKRRLSDTVRCLNRKQNGQIIHFRSDGTGEGVIWTLSRNRKTPAPIPSTPLASTAQT